MYVVEVKKKANKAIRALPAKDRECVLAALNILRENPLAGKPLEGEYKGFRSLRVWPYRILYVLDHRIITVTVV